MLLFVQADIRERHEQIRRVMSPESKMQQEEAKYGTICNSRTNLDIFNLVKLSLDIYNFNLKLSFIFL